MSFSSFKSFGHQVAIPKLLKYIIMDNEFLKNESFEVPNINGIKSYNDMTTLEKEQFKWVGGGNIFNGQEQGPRISDGGSGFGFPNYINGEQALAMQRTSFIEQTIYLNVGTYVFSTYYIGRNGTENNPIQVSINGTIITTIDQVRNTWTLFTHTFNILVAEDKILRLEGTSEEDLTTGIDLVALSRKTYFQDLVPFIWFKYDDGDVTGNKLKNYGTQNIDGTLNSDGSNSVIPNIQTTGQIRGSGCMNFTATGGHGNEAKGGFITLGQIQIPINGFTISQWFKLSNTQRSARLFDFSNGRNINSILSQFVDNNKGIDTYTTEGANHLATTSNIITDDIFHHYVFTVFSNGRWNIYIDNVLILDEIIGYPNLSNRVQNYIGKSSFSGDAYFNGQFDDFRYYERTITSEEVNILYNDVPKN
jgi:hypothetical protein